MPRIAPLEDDELPDTVKAILTPELKHLGFRLNDSATFARVPGLVENLSALTMAIYGQDGLIPQDLKQMISIITSTAAGCVYCQSHTVYGAEVGGVDEEKIKAIWEYEVSPLFTNAERAALRVAQGAGHAPVQVTDADFDELKKHYDDNQICEIVAVIAMFGFTNKWNDTLATEIESTPLASLKKLGPSNQD